MSSIKINNLAQRFPRFPSFSSAFKTGELSQKWHSAPEPSVGQRCLAKRAQGLAGGRTVASHRTLVGLCAGLPQSLLDRTHKRRCWSLQRFAKLKEHAKGGRLAATLKSRHVRGVYPSSMSELFLGYAKGLSHLFDVLAQ